MESSPLVGLAMNTLESFDNILKFCNAQEYLKLGQTCRDLHSVFIKDNTWNILLHGSRCPMEDGTDSDNSKNVEDKAAKKFVPIGSTNEDPYQFVGDSRIATVFEQIMIGHNVLRVKQENRQVDTIIWGKSTKFFVRMWLVYAFKTCSDMYKEVPFIGKLVQILQGQDVSWSRKETTFLKAFATLLEANVLHILQGALQATIDNSGDEYPMLTTSDLHAFVLSMHMSIGWHLWRQDHLQEFHEFFPENGGRNGPRFTLYDPPIHYEYYSGSLKASTYRMIQRLMFRAGIVKCEHAVFNYLVYFVSELARNVLNSLRRNCKDEALGTTGDTSNFVVTTRHLEFAARTYWLPITRVLMDDDDDTFYDTILETVGAAQWSSWSQEEKTEYCESLERHEDMDLDMTEYVDDGETDSNYNGVLMSNYDGGDYSFRDGQVYSSDDSNDFDDDEEMEL